MDGIQHQSPSPLVQREEMLGQMTVPPSTPSASSVTSKYVVSVTKCDHFILLRGVTKQWKYSAARHFANCRVSNQKQKHNKRNSLSLHPQQEELLFFLRARKWKRPPLLGLAWAYVISHVPKARTTVSCEATKMFYFSSQRLYFRHLCMQVISRGLPKRRLRNGI